MRHNALPTLETAREWGKKQTENAFAARQTHLSRFVWADDGFMFFVSISLFFSLCSVAIWFNDVDDSSLVARLLFYFHFFLWLRLSRTQNELQLNCGHCVCSVACCVRILVLFCWALAVFYFCFVWYFEWNVVARFMNLVWPRRLSCWLGGLIICAFAILFASLFFRSLIQPVDELIFFMFSIFYDLIWWCVSLRAHFFFLC